MSVARNLRWKRPVAVTAAATLGLSLLAATPSAAHEGDHGDAHVLIFTATPAGPWHDEAIDYGTPVLQDALDDAGITSEATDDPSVFNDEDLAHYDALVMFQTNGDPWNDEQKQALQNYQQNGGGIAAIHNATDMRGDYDWWDDLVGTLMPGHADTSPPEGLEATVQVEDSTHPATSHLEGFEWVRSDEWYNFSTNVRGDAHVLLSMDETTYDPGGNAMGYDHPISWCKLYDGGRAFATALGHFPSHYDEPEVIQHMVGGIEWAAGAAPGDCGGTDWGSYEKVALDQNTSAPFGLTVAPDRRVFFTELVRGEIRVFDPETHTTSTALDLDVYYGGEDGLLGITVGPNFEDTGHLYVYWSPASDDDSDPANFFNRVSRFTVDENSMIDPASEEVIIEVPARRQPDEPGHTGGDLDFDLDGNLLISVGDDVNPHSEPSGGYAPLSEREGTFHDARETSANTNDLRGKLLRITPEADGGYSIPEGNLFDEADDTDDETRPEIYAMGFRNPFRFTVDPDTGWIGLADYAPDNGQDAPDTRGPAGIVEWNLIKEPGNYGWPLCIGPNEPYRDVDYTTDPVTVGDYFDCDNPINDSTRNTGKTELPVAREADMYYGYQTSSIPEVIPPGGGLAPMGGPFYDFDPDLESETKFPEYFDGKPFFYEWSKNDVFSLLLDDAGEFRKANPYLPDMQFLAPQDMEFGPDGSLYVLEWGGGFGRDNPDSGVYRIDYVSGSRSPMAEATATPDSGHAPLEVEFSSEGSHDPEDEEITYAWDFENDGEVDSTDPNPVHTYTEDGAYDARLTVTDPHGKSGTTTVPITVGNTRPTVDFTWPPDGGFFEWGDELAWDLDVSDPEDDEIVEDDVIVQPAIGHDDHAHSFDPVPGLTGSWTADLGGHSRADNAFYVFDGRYTDQGTDTAPRLSGSEAVVLQPKIKQGEHFTSSDGVDTVSSADVEVGNNAIAGQDGAWAAYEPVNLTNVGSISLRVASATEGTVELRRDAPDGELLGTADVEPTGGLSDYTDVTVDVNDPGETFTLYLVFPGTDEIRLNFFEANGKGISPETRPEVQITSPDGSEQLEVGEVEITAAASDAENEVTEVEFFVDGESVGTDGSAPYSATWNVDEEARYELTAVATNDLGLSTTSRIVVAQVGELYGDFEAFTNTEAEFERLGTNEWAITANGGNMWQGTDEYGSLYLPAVSGDRWMATVKVDGQENTNDSAKAGLIVRNDVTQPGTSLGYGAMAMRAGLSFEWLTDTDGNGELDASSSAGEHGYPAWVRIFRDGDEYTAYWSTDGENFTQVGEPQVLPGADDVQDIGIAVTAHNATETSRAEFSEFELDLDPEDPGDPEPDPDPDYPGPVCRMQQSDEFDGDALHAKRWTAVRTAGDAEVALADGSLVLPVVEGDINEGTEGPISYAGQPAREGEWEIETEVSIEHTREWQHAGLLMHGSDDDYVKLAFTRNSAGDRIMEFQTETDGSREWHDNVTLPSDFPSTAHLRLASDGAELTAAYSADGEDWTALDGAAQVIEDATVGVMAAGDTDTPEVDASFAHFSVTPDIDDDGAREPSDEFDGDAVDGCRWSVGRTAPEAELAVTDGQLVLPVTEGDINEGESGPISYLGQPAPEGEWEFETRLTLEHTREWQYTGLMLHADDDNYVRVSYTAGSPSERFLEFQTETDGSREWHDNNVEVPGDPDTVYLRLASDGSELTAAYSVDGEEWTDLEGAAPLFGDATVGVAAAGDTGEMEADALVDYFRVVDGEQDTTPPEVEVTTDPGEPDGENGWFVSPVTVTASATDDSDEPVLIETRDPDGDWEEYTGALEISEDGVHDLQFRGTDDAGNVSEPVDVAVELDAGAPELVVDGVEDGGSYELGTELAVDADAEDAVSGVASVSLELDGDALDMPATITPEVGEHTLAATASDEAGNVAEVTVTFEVDVSYAGTHELLDTLYGEGVLERWDYHRLRNQLAVAGRAVEQEHDGQAERALDRFIGFAERVSDDDAGAQLIGVAEALKAKL
ncbi:DUF1349 domain-containing protein [Actinobacteria bacterium YIM 96077]|uniref:PKD domain-containing protein n=1 Tax=Phytoactinopolyspora halophila TaxID=1981511 RepID=A0A329QHT3_9ACTN|nr:ThuA domain-containing protein [Phytoactinopolyspora halophila]AYY14126.1 DUF1349 domain-containing protein [Actinobacteria bacterium YIM 96077]RAW09938.1 hypothetical protein DPM12_19845 [Phytoactinopolyspora halophila]